MSDDSIFTLRDFNIAFVALVARGELAAAHIWDAWHRDQVMGKSPQRVNVDDAPSDLRQDLHGSSGDSTMAKMLRKWNPKYGIRLPLVVAWLLDPKDRMRKNQTAFEALDMDRAAFVRELLDDTFFGPRMRYEVANNPYLLGFLPEDERWERLEAAVREFATAIDWSWPYYTAKNWSEELTATLVRRLVTDPELAGSFLVGERAHIGWLIFWDLGEFFDILKTAMLHAPYEACLNRAWIATAIGDRMVNERSFMKLEDDPDNGPWYGWWMDPARVHREFGSKGEARAIALISEAFLLLLNSLTSKKNENPHADLSGASQELARRIVAIPVEIKPSAAKRVAEILIDLPDCNFSRSLLDLIIEGCKLEELSHVYRWLLSAEHRWSLARYYVLGKTQGESLYVKFTSGEGENRVRASWIDRYVRRFMEKHGWRFHVITYRRNQRFGEKSQMSHDPQARFVSDGVTVIYALWRGFSGTWCDYYPDRPPPQDRRPSEVMIPPQFEPGDPVFTSGAKRVTIYHVGDRIPLAMPWSEEYVNHHRLNHEY